MPNKYYKLAGAIITDTSYSKVYQVSVVLQTRTVEFSKRILIPKSQILSDGKGSLYATKWIIDRKNEELVKKRIDGKIKVDPKAVIFV